MADNVIRLGISFLADSHKLRMAVIGIVIVVALLGFVSPEIASAGCGPSACHCGGGC